MKLQYLTSGVLLTYLLSCPISLATTHPFKPLHCDLDEAPAFIIHYAESTSVQFLKSMGLDAHDQKVRKKLTVTPSLLLTETEGEIVDETALFHQQQIKYKPFKQTSWETLDKVYTHTESKGIYSVRDVTTKHRGTTLFRLGSGKTGSVAGTPCKHVDMKVPGALSRQGCDVYLYDWLIMLHHHMEMNGGGSLKETANTVEQQCVKKSAIAVPLNYPWQ